MKTSQKERDRRRLAYHANKERERKAFRAWVEKNRERRRAYARERNKNITEEERERRAAYLREYRKKNPEKNKAYVKKWRESNRDRAIELVNAWSKANPDARQTHSANRRARKAVGPGVTKAEWQDIKTKYKHSCAYCLKRSRALTMDHIVALAVGGRHEPDNIAPACMSCNKRKHIKPVEQFATEFGRLL